MNRLKLRRDWRVLAFPFTALGLGLLIWCTTGNRAHGEPAQPATAAPPNATAAEGAPGPSVKSGQPADGEVIGSVSLAERLAQGGVTMYFLAALSIVAVTFTLERFFCLRRKDIFPRGLSREAMELWAAGKYEELVEKCRAQPSTLGAIIEAFVRHRHCTPLELSMLAGDLASLDMRGHLQRVYPLGIVATLAPLLGLFGTVLGMIESFEVVAIAGSLGDASLLAGGISKALVTTAAGLAIAVPSLGFFHFFRSRAQAYTMALEGEVNELLTTWFMDRPEEAREKGEE